MKKVQITPVGKESIEGYTQIAVQPNEGISMDEFNDNSCDSILASDILDSYALQNHQPLLNLMVSKLRLGGDLVVGGTCIGAFCRTALTGVISHNEASNMIGQTSSMSEPNIVRGHIEGLGLKVESVHIDGLHFEVKAKRG